MGLISSLRRSASTALLFTVVCAAPSAQSATPMSTAWLLAYEGKSTNELIRDRRVPGLVQTRIPAPLSARLMRALAGPPDPVWIAAHRFVSLAACVPHDCGEKGLLWVDTATGIGLGAYAAGAALTLASNGMTGNAIAPQARQALIAWIAEHDLHLVSVTFIGQDGASTVLDPASFQPPDKFHPPVNGPSFDCGVTLTRVQGAVCQDAALALADLALAKLVEQMRDGMATSIDRKQLTDLQRAWEKSRDASCTDAVDMAACLNESYRLQQDRLWHWIPKK